MRSVITFIVTMTAKQALPKANHMTAADTNRTLSKAPAPTSASDPPEKEVKRSSHSDVMRAVWARRWAEGRSGLHGGKPLPISVKLREEKLAKTGKLSESGRLNGRRTKRRKG